MELQFWHWLVLGLVLIGLETMVPGAFFLWSGVAALVTGSLLWLIPLAWPVQLVIFSVLSLVTFFTFRKWWNQRKLQEPEIASLNRRSDSYIGRQFTLSESIVNGVGRMKVDDSEWRVEGPDLSAGTRVVVRAVRGGTMHVEAESVGTAAAHA